jgi:hypothetical protein
LFQVPEDQQDLVVMIGYFLFDNVEFFHNIIMSQ